MPSINITADVFDHLSKVAFENGCTQAEVVNTAIEQYLAQLAEDREDIATAERIMAEIETGKMKMYPAEEVYEELGL